MFDTFPPRKKFRHPALGESEAYSSSGPFPTQTVGIHQAMPYLAPKGPLDLGLYIPEAATRLSTPGASHLLEGEPGAREKHTTDEFWPMWSLKKGE